MTKTRRWVAALLLLALCALPGAALAKELDKKLFSGAKEAVSLISYGEYKKALKKLGLPSTASDVEAFAAFAEEHLGSASYGDVQTDVSVGYQLGKTLKLAVPITAPDGWNVEALVLLSKDGHSFTGYKAMSWGDVLTELEDSDSAIWNKPYDPDTPLIVADE